ncbi:MAG: hypothetical protein ACI9E1_000120 [Cryomorphaceae bacterium]|jgi:hypothetical protein
MSWYHENKFAATLLGVTVVASGALAYLGMSANSDADVARKKEQIAVKKIDALQAAKPYPNEENEQMLADGLAIFATDTKRFQDNMLTFRPEKMRRLSANEFNGEVSRYIRKLTSYYRSKEIELPNTKVKKSYFGMELYASNMANEAHISYLEYNRQALDWLFTTLANSGIEKINNIYRDPVAENLGDASKPAASPKGQRSNKKKNVRPAALTSVYDGLPIEITFTGTEASLQKFMTKVAAGDEYFFAIKFLKIRNEEQEPVILSNATFAATAAPVEGAVPVPAPADGAGFALGTGFDFGEDAFPAAVDKEIIKQVIGDERITVFMQLELVLFKEASSVIIPRLKKEKPLKKSSKKGSLK